MSIMKLIDLYVQMCLLCRCDVGGSTLLEEDTSCLLWNARHVRIEDVWETCDVQVTKLWIIIIMRSNQQRNNYSSVVNGGFSRQPCWRAETMKQFCMKIDLISQGRENVFFCPPTWRQWRHMKMVERRKVFFFSNITNTILYNIHCFLSFLLWPLNSVKTDIYWTAKCTCKGVLLDTNRQSTLRHNVEVS